MTRLTLRLLGSLQVICDGSSVTFAYDKVAALLAYLAVESGRHHSREGRRHLWTKRYFPAPTVGEGVGLFVYNLIIPFAFVQIGIFQNRCAVFNIAELLSRFPPY